MAATFEVIGKNVILKFEWTIPVADALSIVGNSAEYLFGHGYGNHGDAEFPILFSDLDSQKQLDILYKHFADVAVNAAHTNKSLKAQEAARAAEELTKLAM
jgi:hypothetical protein